MLRAFVLCTCMVSWFVVAKVESEPLVGADLSGAKTLLANPPEETSPPAATPVAPTLPLIAGRPFTEAQAILQRHEQELINLPGADGVSFDSAGIIVYTDNPVVVPPSVEGLPVRTLPPLGRGPLPPSQEETDLFTTESGKEKGVPLEAPCGPEAYWDAELGHCQRHETVTVPDPNLLPPPPGVTILRPDKTREQAETCPEGFQEHMSLGNWRFCLDPSNPEPIPPLMVPPWELVLF
ncbi:MAG: hypothetical protein AB7P69_17455 [Candidatus Binatia bacterium]